MQLMSLGQFVFGLPTLAPQSVDRRSSWRHATSSRVGAAQASQFVGPGDDNVSLAGLLLPEFRGSIGALDTLRTMADQGAAYPLVNGTGKKVGDYRIDGIDERGEMLLDNGVPRKVDFRIELTRVVLDASAAGGQPTQGPPV